MLWAAINPLKNASQKSEKTLEIITILWNMIRCRWLCGRGIAIGQENTRLQLY